jgi:hypothetical protein
MSNWWCCNCDLMCELDVHLRCSTCGSEAVVHPEPIRIAWPSPSASNCVDIERLYRIGAI